MKSHRKLSGIYAGIIILLAVAAAAAQTTAFNFQGRLNDGTSPANGRYDLEFRLYDGLTGDNIVGTAISKPNLMLVNGVFSTQLDFGVTAFSGANRFLEIRLRATGSGNGFVVLGPRQQILSVPYSIRSLRSTFADDATHAVNADNANSATTAANSTSLGGVAATNYLLKNGDGSQLTNVNAVTAATAVNSQQLGGVAASQYVQQGTPGTVKAMAVVSSFYNTLSARIERCYNSNLTGSAATTPPCGFTVNNFTDGGYGFDFGFNVTNRFVLLTTQAAFTDGNGTDYNAGIYYDKTSNPNNIDVRTYKSGETTRTTNVVDFVILVF